MSGDVNVPKRRFKEFLGTEGWEKRKLSHISTRVTRKNKELESTLPLTISAQYGLVDQYKYFNNRVAGKNISGYYLIKNGEFAYNKSYSDGYPWGAIKRLDMYDMGILSTLYIIFKIDKDVIDSDYLTVFYDTNLWHKDVEKRAAEGARNHGLLNITADDFFDTNVSVPKLTEEQTKIGQHFKKLDSIITLNQRKLEKLKALKKAYLTQMFPAKGESKPKLRFAGFNDEWEECKLGDVISDLKSGLSRMLSNNDIGLPVIRANNIDDGHLDLLNDIKYWYINDPQGANINNYLIEEDDLLINFINSESKMGTAAIVTETPIRKTIYTTNILRLRTNEKCYNKFLLALTMTNNYKEYIKGISKTAVNQASFTTVDYKNYDMLIPSIIEQQKIGVLLDKIDKLILLYQRKLEKLQNLKKAYLNEMFI